MIKILSFGVRIEFESKFCSSVSYLNSLDLHSLLENNTTT